MISSRKLIDKDQAINILWDEVDEHDKDGSSVAFLQGIIRSIDIIETMEEFHSKKKQEQRACRECRFFDMTLEKVPSGQQKYVNGCVNDFSRIYLKTRRKPSNRACRMFEERDEHETSKN